MLHLSVMSFTVYIYIYLLLKILCIEEFLYIYCRILLYILHKIYTNHTSSHGPRTLVSIIQYTCRHMALLWLNESCVMSIPNIREQHYCMAMRCIQCTWALVIGITFKTPRGKKITKNRTAAASLQTFKSSAHAVWRNCRNVFVEAMCAVLNAWGAEACFLC